MPNSNYPLHFETVIERLNEWRETTIDELREPATHEATLELKRQLDNAIACLELCARHQIHPNCQITVLPPTRTRTPSSEYRIIEDNESEDRANWIELEVSGQQFRPNERDIILSDTD